MPNLVRRSGLVAALLVISHVAQAEPATTSTTTLLSDAIASQQRSAENRARDPQRHPQETLLFFGIEPDMRVLELWPGTGWYTEILAPFLAADGKLTITNFDPNGPQDKPPHKMARELAARLASEPALRGVEVIEVAPPEKIGLGPDASYDLVVTFRNNHGWINGGYHDAMYREIFRVLKPGGVLGVEQHRAPAGADPRESAKNGYVPVAFLVDAAKRAGFELAAQSEINANPRDTKDYPEGVWTLPPTYRLGDVDRAKYAAIGESDRMTLRFVKPATAPSATP